MIGWRITRFFPSGKEEADDRVVVELPLEIVVNGMPLVALMRLPGMDQELAVGFCLTEGIIDDVKRIKLLRHCGSLEAEAAAGEIPGGDALDKGNVVELEVESPRGTDRFSSTYVVRTGCGGADLSAIEDYHQGWVTSELRIPSKVLYGLEGTLTARQEVFRATGGTHGAGVFDGGGQVLVVAEDVGRHNALDKVVGWCALRGISLEDKILMLSGRVSFEMALKAVRVRIPVLVSVVAASLKTMRIAERAGLTVAGFCDGKRFNVYTHGWRILP